MSLNLMPTLPSLEEAQRDINQTNYDLVCLSKVESAIQFLIEQSEVENKSVYSDMLRRVQVDIRSGTNLVEKISKLIATGAIN